MRKLTGMILGLVLSITLNGEMTAFADTMYVNASHLNMRNEAAMTGEVLHLLPRGTAVERVQDLGEWSLVTVNGKNGYVASRYLVNEQSSAGQTSAGQVRQTSAGQTDAGQSAKQSGASGQTAETTNAAQPHATSANIAASWDVSLDTNAPYASFSKINSGKAIFYQSSSANRKEKTICVNAGHGTKGGSSVKTLCHPDGTPKVTGGTTSAGATTAVAVSSGMTFNDGTPESKVTLAMAKVLKEKLLAEGYDVLMIREDDDVQLDNIARTVLANTNADCHIALHWDSTATDKGCFFMSVPNNAAYRAMEPVASHWQSHNRLGTCLIDGLRAHGNKIFSSGSMEMDLTQTSYSTVPSVDIELGDKASSYGDATLSQLADGLVSGINQFFQ